MAEFADNMKKYEEMCEYYNYCSAGCPLETFANKYNITCVGLLRRHPEEAEKAIMAWEKPVDWSKIPVDTKILVGVSENNRRKPRYFAKFENDKIFTWAEGRSSFTAYSDTDIVPWKYAKLAEEDDG